MAAADVAVIIELFNGGKPMRFTIADGAAGTDILKGTLMEISADRTIQPNTNINAPIAGVLTHEKVGADGSTTASVYTDGIFDMLTDGDSDVRGVVMANTATENVIGNASAANLLDGSVVGKLLETSGAGTTNAVRVNL